MNQKNISLLKSFAAENGISLSDSQLNKLDAYFQKVVESNKLFNLTAITEEDDFADSLAGVSEIPAGANLMDIGAGAGFPSVPIAIARPDVKVTALDSTAKKMLFIFSCANQIEIENVSTVIGRAEEQSKYFGSFDAVTARAVSALPILLELAMPLLKVGGVFLAYKTDDSELADCANAMKILGAEHIKTKSLTLPNGDPRAILVFKKTSATPQSYPRQYGTIKKKPL